VPAAAVIPAPIAYIKVVAVKKLVVELWAWAAGPPNRRALAGRAPPFGASPCPSLGGANARDFYFEKIRVFKAGSRLNTLAWNNGIGLWFYFVGLKDQGND
jgi:hypothetical protein